MESAVKYVVQFVFALLVVSAFFEYKVGRPLPTPTRPAASYSLTDLNHACRRMHMSVPGEPCPHGHL